jgi:hypothetical protein
MAKIKVYPTSKTSMVLDHPIDGKLKCSGSEWEQDGFTARMITDGACTVDKGRGWVDDTPAPDPSKLPAHATVDEETQDEKDAKAIAVRVDAAFAGEASAHVPDVAPDIGDGSTGRGSE